MPMAPAMLVMTVRPFFVNRFCADSLNAVPKDILAFSLPVRLSAFLLPARGVDSAFLSEGSRPSSAVAGNVSSALCSSFSSVRE